MADSINKMLGSHGNELLKKAIEETISSYWEDKIAVVWQADDVMGLAADRGKNISKDQAVDILHSMLDNHDACYGISWDTIDYHISDLDDMEDCIYCGTRCFEGEGCDEWQADGFND
jgi:hypothetical protein